MLERRRQSRFSTKIVSGLGGPVVCVKPGTHWRQSWIQHGRLCWKSTKSTMLLWPRTHWRQSRPYRQQSRPRQAVEFTLLPICCQNLNVYGNSRLCCRFVAGFGNRNRVRVIITRIGPANCVVMTTQLLARCKNPEWCSATHCMNASTSTSPDDSQLYCRMEQGLDDNV